MTQAKRPARTTKVTTHEEVLLTVDQVRRGLWPKTMADTKYRPYVFAIMARADAEHRKRQAAKKS